MRGPRYPNTIHYINLTLSRQLKTSSGTMLYAVLFRAVLCYTSIYCRFACMRSTDRPNRLLNIRWLGIVSFHSLFLYLWILCYMYISSSVFFFVSCCCCCFVGCCCFLISFLLIVDFVVNIFASLCSGNQITEKKSAYNLTTNTHHNIENETVLYMCISLSLCTVSVFLFLIR